MKIIDVNAGFGFWPIQRFTFGTLSALDGEYERLGVEEVWLSAVESILYPEPETYDERLISAASSYPRFRVVKTLNPLLANWEARLRAAHSSGVLRAVKLFPNYHSAPLALPAVKNVCTVAAELRLPVLIQMRVNDERNQPACLQMSAVPAGEIATLAQEAPETLFIALAPYHGDLKTLSTGGANLLADLSFVDYSNAVGAATRFFPEERLVFGSHAPWLLPQAAVMKLQHPEIPPALAAKVGSGNLLAKLDGLL